MTKNKGSNRMREKQRKGKDRERLSGVVYIVSVFLLFWTALSHDKLKQNFSLYIIETNKPFAQIESTKTKIIF